MNFCIFLPPGVEKEGQMLYNRIDKFYLLGRETEPVGFRPLYF